MPAVLCQDEDWIGMLIDRHIVSVREKKDKGVLFAIFKTSDGNIVILRTDPANGFKTVPVDYLFELDFTIKFNELDDLLTDLDNFMNSLMSFKVCECLKRYAQLLKSKGQDVPDFLQSYLDVDCKLTLPKLDCLPLKIKCQLMGGFELDYNVDANADLGILFGKETEEMDWKDELTNQRIIDINVSVDRGKTVVYFTIQGGKVIPVTYNRNKFYIFNPEDVYKLQLGSSLKNGISVQFPNAEKILKDMGLNDPLSKFRLKKENGYCGPAIILSLPEIPDFNAKLNTDLGLNVDANFKLPKLKCNFKLPKGVGNLADLLKLSGESDTINLVEGYGYDEDGNSTAPELQTDIPDLPDEEQTNTEDACIERFPDKTDYPDIFESSEVEQTEDENKITGTNCNPFPEEATND